MVFQQQERGIFLENNEAQRRQRSQFTDKDRQDDGLRFLFVQGF